MRLSIYDCTLRDGTQGEGFNLSLEDKLEIAKALDAFGVHYIEGGWPGSNPKDARFFEAMKSVQLKMLSSRRLVLRANPIFCTAKTILICAHSQKAKHP